MKTPKIKKSCQGYSIWLVPKNSVYTSLSKIISTISKELNSPDFPPHVTLIGKLKPERGLIQKAEKLASTIKPLTLRLNQPSVLNEYYRSLFLKVKETNEVTNANQLAQEIFNRQEKYFPHLSLMYGDFSTIKKLDIISRLEKINLEFPVDSIRLYSTTGELKDWYEVAKFSLK